MKRQGDEYETIVLGSGLGGLIAAAFLSSHHRKVLCLRERPYSRSFARSGYRFTPFSNFAERRLKSSLLKPLSQALSLPSIIQDQKQGRKGESRPDLSKQRVAFQVILPKARVDLFLQGPISRMEWRREFPREVAQIENFYNELGRIQRLLKEMKAKMGSWSILPLRRLSRMKRWFLFTSLPAERMDKTLSPFSTEFRQFIQLQLISQCNLYTERFPISLASHLLLDDEGGGWGSHIEFEKIEKELLERSVQLGGRVEEIEGVEKVDIGWWRKRATLVLKGREQSIRSRFLILNSPLHHLSPFFGKKEKLLSKWGERVRPRYALLPLFLAIDEKAVPVGMRDLLVSILNLDHPYEGGNVLFLSLSQEGDLMAAPEGKRALTVESLIPVGKWEKSSLDQHVDRVMKHIHHLFPFLEKYVEFQDWSWAEEQSLRWSYPHFIYETDSDFGWREEIIPLRIEKNVYFAGKENFPCLGLEGEIVGGWRIGNEILQRSQ